MVPVPDELVARMREAEAAGSEETEGVLIARELAAMVRPHVQGIQVVAPRGDVSLALQVIDAAR